MTPTLTRALDALARGDQATLASVPDGFDVLVVADLARALAGSADGPAVLVHVARDGLRQQALQNALQFVAPEIEVLAFPAWDCQPYDRVSPNTGVTAQRMTALSRLTRSRSSEAHPRILSTTVNAVVQRVIPRGRMAKESFSAAPGNMVATDALVAWLEINGFLRTGTVRDTGEYAVRGGIIDLYPPGLPNPIRLDFFGDTLESIRSFDPETQRTVGQLRALDLVPMSEVQLTTESIRRFRQAHVAQFGAPTRDDRLYEAVSEGRRYAGMEHWLPLFHERLDTLFDYVPGVPVVFDNHVEDAVGERLAQVKDYYDARKSALATPQPGIAPYKPLPPDALYLKPEEWAALTQDLAVVRVTPFALPESEGRIVVDCAARRGRDFIAERAEEGTNVFDAAVTHVRALQGQGRRVMLASWSEGSRERLCHVLNDHGLTQTKPVGRLADALSAPKDAVPVAVWGLESGFEAGDLAVVSEQDILGDRLVRPKRRSRRPQDFIAEAAALTPGDLVVHVDHGIGRFEGLKTIEAAGAPHDCLEIHYHGGDRLFLPVENIELLTRYGSEEAEVQLDRLGGGAWQARKARMKKRIREMAGALMKIAAARILREAPRLSPPEGLYDEFAARFPYEETEDQQGAIDAVMEDLSVGRPMDRLVCGDVGFGKTEVAVRAAFAVAAEGKQTLMLSPTTILAQQHWNTFRERYRDLPVRVEMISRFRKPADVKAVLREFAEGKVDILIGTHRVLSRDVIPKNLGLVVVDEEQRFGVAQKELLRQLRLEVDVLALTATPIPRTLHMSLAGLRDIRVIETPPAGRRPIRTHVGEYEEDLVRIALLREHEREGQSFYLHNRVDTIEEAAEKLRQLLPELRFLVAHGQMRERELEEHMLSFLAGDADVLVSTTIIESGLDIPQANTLVVERA
ncbi:MAG: transcription-repair coupling factor, partial [Microvirga sp.]